MDGTSRTELQFGEKGQVLRIPLDTVTLEGELTIPVGTQGIVVFAHGSGSGRHSPRNKYVASIIQREGVGTLLLDLLTRDEEATDVTTRQYRFNIELLADRLIAVTEWLKEQPETSEMKIGYFGASTGAGAALMAAGRHPEWVSAVVSRGGRPDLAGPELQRVEAPTLLIVGGEDTPVISLNRDAMARMRYHKELVIVPGATHLFEEPGKLEEAARLAADWFVYHFGPEWCQRGVQ